MKVSLFGYFTHTCFLISQTTTTKLESKHIDSPLTPCTHLKQNKQASQSHACIGKTVSDRCNVGKSSIAQNDFVARATNDSRKIQLQCCYQFAWYNRIYSFLQMQSIKLASITQPTLTVTLPRSLLIL
jgi:hypothetical protein